jgi:hypothetical protein
MWTRAIWIALVLAVVLLARGLPPETFFVGDPGVKLVAARAALDHPSRPLDIPLPDIGGERVAFVEPFFDVHGDHTHAVTSELFPILSAPLIAVFGIRGAFVLPALGFLLAVWGCARLAATDERPVSAGELIVLALVTPTLFYGLEFWEHAPAVGLAAIATTMLLGRTAASTRAGIVAGILYGIAILLRPEAAWFVLALAVSSPLLPALPGLSKLAPVVLGIGLATAPLAAYSLVHFGAVTPPHLGTQAQLLTTDWLSTRAQLASAWFLPFTLRPTSLWGFALLAVAVMGCVAPGVKSKRTRFLGVAAFADIALVFLTAPNDGGGQWGPRYLLFAYVPASLLVVDALRAVGHRRFAGAAAALLVIAGAAWVQRAGYRELRGTKIIYGRVLDLVRQQVPPRGFAITDLWWLDQVAAAATSDRTMLFVRGEDDRRDALVRLHRAGQSTVTAFLSREESPDVDAWSHLPCFEPAGHAEIDARTLVAITLKRLPDCDRDQR